MKSEPPIWRRLQNSLYLFHPLEGMYPGIESIEEHVINTDYKGPGWYIDKDGNWIYIWHERTDSRFFVYRYGKKDPRWRLILLALGIRK